MHRGQIVACSKAAADLLLREAKGYRRRAARGCEDVRAAARHLMKRGFLTKGDAVAGAKRLNVKLSGNWEGIPWGPDKKHVFDCKCCGLLMKECCDICVPWRRSESICGDCKNEAKQAFGCQNEQTIMAHVEEIVPKLASRRRNRFDRLEALKARTCACSKPWLVTATQLD